MCKLKQFQIVLQKEEEREKEKCKENKMNFQGSYLWNSWVDSAQIN